MIYYKNREHFGNDEYHLVSAEQMAKYAERDNYEQETPYFHFAEVVRLDKIEDGNFYFSLRSYN
ncbi:MAG: hypothetical protein J6R67_03040 [Treponema sp.]|nr:hypothetical protein [Treponema sp.]